MIGAPGFLGLFHGQVLQKLLRVTARNADLLLLLATALTDNIVLMFCWLVQLFFSGPLFQHLASGSTDVWQRHMSVLGRVRRQPVLASMPLLANLSVLWLDVAISYKGLCSTLAPVAVPAIPANAGLQHRLMLHI